MSQKKSSNKKVGVRFDYKRREKDTLHPIVRPPNDLTNDDNRVEYIFLDKEDEIDFMESLIEENE